MEILIFLSGFLVGDIVGFLMLAFMVGATRERDDRDGEN